MIAIALACGPDLLIADEPTTALDTTIQREVLDLIDELRRASGMALLLISHDLDVMAAHVERLVVMYGGTIVESGPTRRGVRAPGASRTRAACSRRGRGWAPTARVPLATIPGRVPELHEMPLGLPLRRSLRAGHRRLPRGPAAGRLVGDGHVARCIRWEVAS